MRTRGLGPHTYQYWSRRRGGRRNPVVATIETRTRTRHCGWLDGLGALGVWLHHDSARRSFLHTVLTSTVERANERPTDGGGAEPTKTHREAFGQGMAPQAGGLHFLRVVVLRSDSHLFGLLCGITPSSDDGRRARRWWEEPRRIGKGSALLARMPSCVTVATGASGMWARGRARRSGRTRTCHHRRICC
jgi:hypothetical protein